jgi:hypothetical protein
MVGPEIFLGGEHTPASAFCQVAGRAARIDADAFRQIVRDSVPITALLLRYTHATLIQVSQLAACNRVHSIEERRARWLLMTHDRVPGDRFELTQEFLGEMLGVRSPERVRSRQHSAAGRFYPLQPRAGRSGRSRRDRKRGMRVLRRDRERIRASDRPAAISTSFRPCRTSRVGSLSGNRANGVIRSRKTTG